MTHLISTIAIAMGASWVSGINLYASVATLGLLGRFAHLRLPGELDVLPWMWAPNGYLHAASIVLLADTCAGYATVAHLPEGAKNFTTIELKSNFLGTAKEGRIRTECSADHLGRTTQIWSAIVWGPTGRKLALFRCTQMILS